MIIEQNCDMPESEKVYMYLMDSRALINNYCQKVASWVWVLKRERERVMCVSMELFN